MGQSLSALEFISARQQDSIASGLDRERIESTHIARCDDIYIVCVVCVVQLMSGTPFGTSLMDARGQTRFLGMIGLTGSFLWTESVQHAEHIHT